MSARALTLPNVLSTLAVFLVLAGGSAVAAGLAKNSVDSKVVKNNSLRSADLANGKGATGEDVVDGSLGGADFATRSLHGADFADGSLRGADFADGSLSGDDLGVDALRSANLAPNSLGSSQFHLFEIHGSDIGTNALTGADVAEATIGAAPDAEALGGHRAGDFIEGVDIEERQSTIQEGTPSGNGTFKISINCFGSDQVLAGGAANLSASSAIVESASIGDEWTVVVDPHGQSDPFSVIVLCVGRERG